MDFDAAARRYLGQFPKGAPQSVRLSWWRHMEIKMTAPWLPVLIVVVIVFNATWAYVVFGVMVAWSVWGLTRITQKIRRARRAEEAGTHT